MDSKENETLWKFVAKISFQDDTHNGKVAHALIKRFKKNRGELLGSKIRLPRIKISSHGG